MASFEATLGYNPDLARKGLGGGVILGRYPSSPLLSTLTAPDGIITLPTGYETCGQLSEDGLTFGVEDEVAEVRGWGSASFVRRDITSSDKTLAFSALETRRVTKELVSNLDLRGVRMVNNEIVITHPDRPATKYWRALALGVDGDGDDRYYMGKFYPRSSVGEREEEVWSDGDDSIMFGVTMSGMLDPDAGYTLREFLFGPGAVAAAEAMGWVVSTLTAPTGLAAGAVTADSVELTWAAVPDADGYQVLLSTDNGDSYLDVTAGFGGTPSAAATTVTGLNAATPYRFRLAAVSAAGERGSSSPSIAATTAAA